jgi:hypothetical protein
MEPSAPSEILKRIRSLKALAERAGTEAEAALAAERVRELLERYNLEAGAVRIEEDGAIDVEALAFTKRRQPHIRNLVAAVDVLFGVAGVWDEESDRGRRYLLYGAKANVEAAQATLSYLVAAVVELSRSERIDKRSFRCGASVRIFEMCERHADVSRRSLERGEGDGLAIVRLTEQLTHDYARKRFPGLTMKTESRVFVNANRFDAGYVAGARIDIHGARTSRMLRDS